MPRIEILEKDETSAGVYSANTDVVYIPGLVDTTQACLISDRKYVGLKANVPTLFTTVKSFESLCGTRGATFDSTQFYYDLQPSAGANYSFDKEAVPSHRVMFAEGSIDPSYIMAKELLAAGLHVVYERLNEDSDTYIALESQPVDFDTHKSLYYKLDNESYSYISDSIAPYWYKKLDNASTFGTISDDGGRVSKELKFDYDITLNYDSEGEFNVAPSDGADEDSITFDDATNTYEVKANTLFTFTAEKATGDTAPIPELITIGPKDKMWFTATLNANNEITSFTVVSNYTYEQLMEKDNDGKQVTNIYEYDGSNYYYYSTADQEYLSLVLDEDDIIKPAPINWNSTFMNYYQKDTDTYKPLSANDSFTPNETYRKDCAVSINSIYTALNNAFNVDGKLSDKGSISIKYLTSGGYPTFEYDGNSLASKMVELAESRGDCVAIIDHTNNPTRESNIDREGNVYKVISSVECQGLHSEFATMFTPWFEFNRSTVDRDDDDKILESTENNPIYGLTSIELPGSFAYLITLADSIKTNANWLAVAGSTRGVVQNIAKDGAKCEITNGAADGMQPRDGVAVNAITNIKPYGYTIWGNRTLKNNGEKGDLTATSFLNIRNLVSDVKKQVYSVSRQLTFEQNNDVLWANFKSLISSLLDRMLTGYGISGYRIEKDTTHSRYDKKATLCAKIILYPVYAVEDFYITVVLKDDEISVE